MKELFQRVSKSNKGLYTLNAVKGKTVYGESLIEEGTKELREWNPQKSKLGAAIRNGLKTFPLSKGVEVLYLGAASGTTVSHISDVLWKKGFIYAVEFSPKPAKELLKLAKIRTNIAPIFGNARKPNEYEEFLTIVDVLYQDIAQRDQTDILIRNAQKFLPSGSISLYALKARSISSSLSLKDIAQREEEKLKEHFKILEKINLAPHEKDHIFYVLEKK